MVLIYWMAAILVVRAMGWVGSPKPGNAATWLANIIQPSPHVLEYLTITRDALDLTIEGPLS